MDQAKVKTFINTAGVWDESTVCSEIFKAEGCCGEGGEDKQGKGERELGISIFPLVTCLALDEVVFGV